MTPDTLTMGAPRARDGDARDFHRFFQSQADCGHDRMLS